MFLIQAETGKLLAPWGQYSLSSFLLRGVDTPVSGNELLGVCVAVEGVHMYRCLQTPVEMAIFGEPER